MITGSNHVRYYDTIENLRSSTDCRYQENGELSAALLLRVSVVATQVLSDKIFREGRGKAAHMRDDSMFLSQE